MRALLLSLLFLLGAPSLFANYDWAANAWEKVSESEGIDVYRKSFKDSNVKGVAGSALINASVDKIVWVLMDHEHKSQWVDKIQYSKTLAKPTPLTSIQYATFGMPFPVSDRDFVYSYKFSYDKTKNMILVDVVSVEHRSQPASSTIGVRGEITMGKFRLYPKNAGKKTYVEVEYLADPKGLLPSWVVNIVQKKWPYKTLSGLRKQVKKKFVGSSRLVTEGLKVPLK